MLKKVIIQELIKLDILETLYSLTISAKEYLNLEDKKACLVEIDKMQEYIESLKEIITILKVIEKK